MKAILFPLLPICQNKKKSLLDFHYWILSTPAWEHCLRIKEQMADIMEVSNQLKQLLTLQISFVLSHHRSAHCHSGAQDTSDSSRTCHTPALPHTEALAHTASAAFPGTVTSSPWAKGCTGSSSNQSPKRESCCSSRHLQILSEFLAINSPDPELNKG